MKKWLITTCLLFILQSLIPPHSGTCRDMSREEIIKEIMSLKNRITMLEEQLGPEEVKEETKAEEKRPFHSVKGLAQRLSKVEDELKEKRLLGKWAERIQLSGLVEVEASYEKVNYKNPAIRDEDSSDIALAKVELGVDVDLSRNVKGHVLFLWEEDNTEQVEVDEAFIAFSGADKLPLYLNAGRMYVPFGRFESHFISDPLTLQLGETRESAVVGCFRNDWLELSLGAFNGDIDKTGTDNHIGSYVGSGIFILPKEIISGLDFSGGVSFLSNIADSNGLQEVGTGVSGPTLQEHISGFSAFLSASFMDRFCLEAEYLGATERFKPGELSFDGGQALRPKAWNSEVAYKVTEGLEFAVRYEGSDDCGNFLPKEQYGGALIYRLLENTSLGFEFLHGKFENDDKRDLLTVQVGTEF